MSEPTAVASPWGVRSRPGVPERHRFTVEEYHLMAEAGVLRPDDRTELIAGQILVKMLPVGARHAWGVSLLAECFNDRFRASARIRVHAPIRLNEESKPEPDVMLVRRAWNLKHRAHPTPADVLLVAEMSDSTRLYDRSDKAMMQASAGVVEYWVVDLVRRVVPVHRASDGLTYTSVVEVGPGGALTVATVPDAEALDPATFLPEPGV